MPQDAPQAPSTRGCALSLGWFLAVSAYGYVTRRLLGWSTTAVVVVGVLALMLVLSLWLGHRAQHPNGDK
jgi:FtsH-binding integral membrane protein